MNKNFLWLALPACVISIACAQHAAAAPVTYTYSGTVDVGADDFGLFGGGQLNGAAFTAVFTRDDDLAHPDYVFQGDTGSSVTNFEDFRPVTAVLTINGVAFDIAGGGFQNQYDDGVYEAFSHHATVDGAFLNMGGGLQGTFAPLSGFNYLAGPDYRTLASIDLDDAPGFFLTGAFEYVVRDVEGRTFANLRPTRLTVSPDPGGPVGAVPEPSTWAMMIMGFGGVGSILRRRRALALA